MRVFMFLLAVALMTSGTLIVRASAESAQDPQVQTAPQDQAAPQVQQQQKDIPEAAKRKRKLYA